MRIGRTLPPAAAPVGVIALCHGLAGIASPARAVDRVAADVCRHFGVDRAWLVSSGTAALVLALQALKRRSPRTDVVIPAFTCFSVPAAVMHAGLRPVPCDVSPVTMDLDAAGLERIVGPATLCVIAHDLFGIPADLDRIGRICRPHGTLVIEDAAQAMGVRHHGALLGTRGDVGIFSLGRGKNITCGSGGVVITRARALADAIDEEYARLPSPGRVEMARDWLRAALLALFVHPRLFWIPASIPALHLGDTVFPKKISIRRLSPMQARLLHQWKRRLTSANAGRADVAARLGGRLPGQWPAGPRHPYIRMPVLAASAEARDRIYAWSRARGLGIARSYPTPVSEIPEVCARIGRLRFPIAADIADRILTMPTHQWVSAEDVAAIVNDLEIEGREDVAGDPLGTPEAR